MWIAASAGMMDPFFHSGGARLISDSFCVPSPLYFLLIEF
jgi:hypothetical protein